jgi:hypothetical protein
LQQFLIWRNPQCPFLPFLRVGNKFLRGSKIILASCPWCNQDWSGTCPVIKLYTRLREKIAFRSASGWLTCSE